MIIKNYSVKSADVWTGRVDDTNDPDSFRMHQIVKLIDFNQTDWVSIKTAGLNICFIGFCCDEGVRRNLGRPGAKHGPEYIRKEFANLPVTFNNSVNIFDAGDIFCVENNMEEAQQQLEIATEYLLKHDFLPIVIGGGHELALGHYNGVANFLSNTKDNSLGIINFDAHLDMRPYNNGGSSGTMFSQIADNCTSYKRDFSYMCIGAQTYANTISLFKKADLLGAKYILAKDITEKNYADVNSKIDSFIEKHRHIYVTICSDLFNSAVAPGVSAMQPFGMNPETVLNLVKQIIGSKKVISIDIAEVSPRFDQDNRTAKLAAILIYGIINAFIEARGIERKFRN